jgi:hypothetical protein
MTQYTKSMLLLVAVVASSLISIDAFTLPPSTPVAALSSTPCRRGTASLTRTSMAVVDIDSEAAFDKTIKSAGDSLVVVDYSTTW